MSEFAARREQLLEAMGDGVALFPSAPVALRNHDVGHPYRQDSDLFYLTGLDEPESLLLLTNQHEEHKVVLFVRPKKREREIWDGPRAGAGRRGCRLRCGRRVSHRRARREAPGLPRQRRSTSLSSRSKPRGGCDCLRLSESPPPRGPSWCERARDDHRLRRPPSRNAAPQKWR